MMQCLPILAPLSTTAPMPISVLSPTVQPCSMAWWPTVTPAPRVSGLPGSECSTQASCRLLRGPTRMGSSWSPRRMAPNQTLTSSASSTFPMTWAESATQALSSICGCCSPSAYTAMCLSPVLRPWGQGRLAAEAAGGDSAGAEAASAPDAPEAAAPASSSPICVT